MNHPSGASVACSLQKHLVLGGARSGKSAFAEQLMLTWQQETAGEVFYIATSNHRNDSEMLARVAHHKQHRPVDWQTIEAPLRLAEVLAQLEVNAETTGDLPSDDLTSTELRGASELQPGSVATNRAVLIDCLTLWMLNIIEADCRQTATEQLLAQLSSAQMPVVMVSNEIGLGVVPMGKLSREFVDELGRLHQAIAQTCEQVTFVTAGLPMRLKPA